MVNRPAALLLVPLAAGLVACGSADNDPAQRAEKPVTVETQR